MTDPADVAIVTDRNEVILAGRVSGSAEVRPLPSGDEVAVFRLVVRRDSPGADTIQIRVGPTPPQGRRPAVGQTGRRLLRRAATLDDGDRVVVHGRLRRRWWAAGAARQSVTEVQALEVTRGAPRSGRAAT